MNSPAVGTSQNTATTSSTTLTTPLLKKPRIFCATVFFGRAATYIASVIACAPLGSGAH